MESYWKVPFSEKRVSHRQLIEAQILTEECSSTCLIISIQNAECSNSVNEDSEVGRNKTETDKKKYLCSQIPCHMLEIFRKSCKHISDSESKQFACLLDDFQDVFAKSDTDLGCFMTIKHSIDTGDSDSGDCETTNVPYTSWSSGSPC